MSDVKASTILLVGLSGSGKTNFLVALDLVLDDQADKEGLVHEGLAADRAYLQPLKEKWLRGEELEHTSRQQPPLPHELLVRHPPTGKIIEFHLPDLAGENFDSYFETRSFPSEFAELVSRASGLLLFVHSDQNAYHEIHREPGLADPGPNESSQQDSPEIIWELKDACPQVKIVELLQFVADMRTEEKLRVAVMLSAWDLIENAPQMGPGVAAELPKDPKKFLRLRWPLLDQFLGSHKEVFPSRIFGVSARGGGMTQEEVARLVALERPRERVFIRDAAEAAGLSGDLTRPVQWVLGLLD